MASASNSSTASDSTPHVTVHIDEKEEDDDDFGYRSDDDDSLGYKAEYGTRNFSATIKVDGKAAGDISARLLARPSRAFHSACDADSAELQEIGCVLFGSDGKPRYPALKRDASARSGGFLYISKFHIAPEFRRDGATDVGSAAIGAFLCLPDLVRRWSVAAYIADSQEWMTPEERVEEREIAMAAAFGGEAESASERATRVMAVSERMAKDSRQFVRAGFKEIDYKDGGWLYMSKGMLETPPLTHQAALAVPLRVAAKATGAVANGEVPTPSGKDAELLEFLMTSLTGLRYATNRAGAGVSPAMLGHVDELISQGARPTEAQALHCAAANGIHELFQPLLERGADVNGKGANGATPLMIAAEAAVQRTSMHNPTPSAHEIGILIALGADKNLTDRNGNTALGCFYKSIRSSNDMKAALIGGPKTKVDPTMKAMLMPDNGPSDADKDCEDDH